MSARPRRIFLRILLSLILGGLLLALLAVWLYRSDPRWYRRVQLSDAEQAAAQQRLLDRLATLRNEVGRTKAAAPVAPATPAVTPPAAPTFEIEISEDEVNGVLMRWSQASPELREALKAVDEPHVRFLSNQIEFAGRSKELGTIVSIGLSVTQSPEGPRVQLGRPWAGRMPLSRALIEQPAEQGVAELRKRPGPVPRETIDALAKLVAGERVLPIVPLPSSLQGDGLVPARVETLSVESGVLKATLRPIE